jgi:hypothetical protein
MNQRTCGNRFFRIAASSACTQAAVLPEPLHFQQCQFRKPLGSKRLMMQTAINYIEKQQNAWNAFSADCGRNGVISDVISLSGLAAVERVLSICGVSTSVGGLPLAL